MARILLIDDEAVLRLTFQHGLEQAGHTVWLACDGAEGESVCGRETVDVVISDLVMPVQDGFTTINRIRKRLPAVPIIAMSGFAQSLERDHAMRSGATQVLQKPVTVEQLAACVRTVLNGSAQTPGA